MAKQKKPDGSDCPCQDTSERPDRADVFASLPDAATLDDIMIAAREALERLPQDDDIRRAKLDCEDAEMVRVAALTGKHALHAISGRQGNVAADDAFVAMMLVEQQSMILASVGDTAGPGGRSCIGKCRAERNKCKVGKHRCNFEAFLCRLNCFFTINVGVNVG